ncbi:unnamed protein product [Acanthoscelides obtectus]|uniref:Uncharacterized protein n=1 Tax=Acanthoscelides obtectus TaxID=200917 RepID=A0A9P0LJN4_ACAOB|nr:unnamed protein product [Acanthoscelides obtectus]CAK1620391.1 hypothetical protein AOBTE_LOCUS353 [Acanthoscelides obtectus]
MKTEELEKEKQAAVTYVPGKMIKKQQLDAVNAGILCARITNIIYVPPVMTTPVTEAATMKMSEIGRL